MKDSYSVYEAKARLSEILRAVKGKQCITITRHGHPIARVVPVEDLTLEDHLSELANAGVLAQATERSQYEPVAARVGALEQFLSERDD